MYLSMQWLHKTTSNSWYDVNMIKKPLYTKFPDINTAKNDIQQNATCLEDIVTWVKTNGWFFVATQLYRHQNVWSHHRQQQFYREHRNFEMTDFTLESATSGLRALSHFWDTNLTYLYPKKEVRDDVDYKDGLSVLGLTGGGFGTFRDSVRKGNLCVHVKAKDWHFVARPSIFRSIGSSLWNAESTGANRWYPKADLDSLHLVFQAVGGSESEKQMLTEQRMTDKVKTCDTSLDIPDLTANLNV